jgi:SAM-dependent methyltransferase
MSQQGQWQVAGSAPEVYERELVPAVFGPWAPIVVELAHPSPGERVVDVACGTGIVARIAAARVGPSGSVAAVDLNPGMLNVARSVATNGASASIQWHEASADKLPFPNSSFDIAYCQLGLQFFADRPAALREMHRVLVPEGRLALMVWRGIGESPGFQALAEILEKNIGCPCRKSDPVGNRLRIGRSCVGCAISAGWSSVWSLTCFGREQRWKPKS